MSTSSSFDSSDSEQNYHRKKSRFQVSPAELNNNVKMEGGVGTRKVPKRVASIRSDPQKMRVKYKRSLSATADMPVMMEYNLKQVLTKERVPHMDHYRQSVDFGRHRKMRPTIEELMDRNSNHLQPPLPPFLHQNSQNDVEAAAINNQDKGVPTKLGWIKGVYVKCLLNIWGVMLFLRLSWVVGQAGVIEAISIITLANLVTLITSISMSAVSTNGRIKGGGIYYMLSRSLGPEFGGAIGLMITLANAIAVALYVIGFCESFLDMLSQYIGGFQGIIDSTNRLNDIRLIGSIIMVGILGLAIIGMEWVSRVEVGLLGLLLIAQVDFVIGSFLPPTDAQMANGFIGYSSETLTSNLWSTYQEQNGEQYSFFKVFAVFFPAVTGIVAGANFSGDLKDPGDAIPKGTLAAIATTYVSYFGYCFVIGGSTLREASGSVDEVLLKKEVLNDTYIDNINLTYAFDQCLDRSCPKGSLADQQLMETISAWGPLIYAGCFAATLSSAIASLVGAPRVFQAVAKDKLFPGISTFGDGFGPNNDPLKGYILIFFISLGCILIGDLNSISTLLSNFFVASYALMNFSVFHASITNTPGWRPSFKYYNKWISLFGTILCIAVMFLMSYVTALITFVCIVLLYVFIKSRHLDVNWGSSTQSQYFMTALKAVQSLTKVEDHVKNYRPKLIVLSGDPSHRPSLIDFGNLITKDISLMTCVNVIKDSRSSWKRKREIKARGEKWLQINHIKAFYAVNSNHKLAEGVQAAMDFCGLGKLSPNMVLLGFLEKWYKDENDYEDYFNTLVNAFHNHLSIGVLRLRGGIDLIKMASPDEYMYEQGPFTIQLPPREKKITECSESIDSGLDEKVTNSNPPSGMLEQDLSDEEQPHQGSKLDKVLSGIAWPKYNLPAFMSTKRKSSNHSVISDEMFEKARVFRSKKKVVGTIDVYWLYDDGGLTLLLPYILSNRKMYSGSKLRIFFLSNKIENIDRETRSMAELMAKFRIACEDIVAISDSMTLPNKATRENFLKMVHEEVGVQHVDDTMLKLHSKKINFKLRIAEIARKTSGSTANLVVMTLPVPKMDNLPPPLYMSLLDFTTRDMPPFLYVRGNQESVLTFYS